MAHPKQTKESLTASKTLTTLLPRIPSPILSAAHGLAIFSGIRGGAMSIAGSGGSGIVLRRLADGTWSPPSAFRVSSGSVGLVYGIDVYECVAVLNTPEAVASYYENGVVMGGDISVAAGPLSASGGDGPKGRGGVISANSASGAKGTTGQTLTEEKKAVFTYTKSKGLYGGVTVGGTVVAVKQDVNEGWYGVKGVGVKNILAGEVNAGEWPKGMEGLREVLAAV